MLLLKLKNCYLIFRFYPLPFPVASQSSARAVSTHALNERMKEMSERIEAMDQITQNMDREFKSSRVVSTIGNTLLCFWDHYWGRAGGSRSIFRAENPVFLRSWVFLSSETTRKRLLRRLAGQQRGSAARSAINQSFFLTLVIVPEVFAKVNWTQSPFRFLSGEFVFSTLRIVNILSLLITHGSFTRKISSVIVILIMTGLANLLRNLDGMEEIFKSFHLIDHT